MKTVFIVLGYGLPKDILKDENYAVYLKLVFNNIYEIVIKNNIKNPIIIFSGGKTDIFKPYKRDEAREMIKLFKTLKNRNFLKKITQDWLVIAESQALSTLENILFSDNILKQKKITKATIYIFCEQTRIKKVRNFATKIFSKNNKIKIIGIDFDHSANRYLDLKFIEQKEDQDIKFGLWALKHPNNFKKYHQVFEERLQYFREQGPQKHIQLVQKWWHKKLKELIK